MLQPYQQFTNIEIKLIVAASVINTSKTTTLKFALFQTDFISEFIYFLCISESHYGNNNNNSNQKLRKLKQRLTNFLGSFLKKSKPF